ncbi:MAG: hypothetical protein IJ537_11540 [Bacteroidaceae bacterium]|nr:hypothetical protein [Bacteroidaceae bacterium]MBQ9169393.1 hypothetical protein [Bacteroidaceae bacterium]MBQ9295309.1 hypothetical protein [Bacteroidaceae bacterium]
MSWLLWLLGGIVLFVILCRTGIIVPMVILPVGMFVFTLVVDLILFFFFFGKIKDQGFPIGAWIFAGIYLLYNIFQFVADDGITMWFDDAGDFLGVETSGRWFAILSIVVILVETPALYWLFMTYLH